MKLKFTVPLAIHVAPYGKPNVTARILDVLAFAAYVLGLFSLSVENTEAAYFTEASAVAHIWDGSTQTLLQPWEAQVNSGGSIASDYDTTSAWAWNPGGTFDGRTADNAYAEANLSTGTLSATGHVSNSRSAANIFVTSGGEGGFGDSFSAFAPTGPFVWNLTDTATFTMNVTGTIDQTNVIRDPATAWTVNLYILKPGSLSPNGISFNDALLAYAQFNEARPLIGAAWTWNQFSGDLAGNAAKIPISLSHSGSFETGGAQMSATFNPGGDFDWIILFDTSASLAAGVGDLTHDFSHTLSVEYTGPAGTDTQSASGVFPGTTTVVPLPAAAWLMLSGCGSLLAFGRRKTRLGETA